MLQNELRQIQIANDGVEACVVVDPFKVRALGGFNVWRAAAHRCIFGRVLTNFGSLIN